VICGVLTATLLLLPVLSCLQAMVESLLKEFPNVLTLRVRMPIVMDLTYERNFITKIIKYDKVRRSTSSSSSLLAEYPSAAQQQPVSWVPQ
jgi:hypothetical protein